jgi:septal ring factor EnvC (AmiA/AmiB activator)
LEPDKPLPKNPGRYTAIAPALPVSESLAAILPATAAFQPRNLQTIFSPSKQDVDLAIIRQQIDDLKRNTVKQDKMIVELKQENVRFKQEIVELKQKNDQLNEDSRRHQSNAEQLRTLNTSILKRVASLEEEVKGFKVISQNAAEWATLVGQNHLRSVVTL